MKKLLQYGVWGICFLTLFFTIPTQGSDNQYCLDIKEDEVCLSMQRDGDRFSLQAHLYGSMEALRCQVEAPAGENGATIYDIPGCDDEFVYEGSTRDEMNVFVRTDKGNEYAVYEIKHDRRTGEGSEEHQDDDGDDDYSSEEIDTFDVNVDDTKVERYQDIDLTIYAEDNDGDRVRDYDERIKLTVYEYTNGDWNTAESDEYNIDDRYHRFDTDDDGRIHLSDIVEFTKAGRYKVKIQERYDADIYGWSPVVYVDADSDDDGSSPSASFFDISFENSPFDTTTEKIALFLDDQDIDVEITALDEGGGRDTSYQGVVEFSLLKFTNGVFRSAYSSEYTMSDKTKSIHDDDNGKETFNDLLSISKQGIYLLKVTDKYEEQVYDFSPFLLILE